MKKSLKRMIALTFAFVMVLSTSAFAAENSTKQSLIVQMSENKAVSSADESSLRAPAPAVTKVSVIGGSINSNGHVIVQVYIEGYGKNEIAKWDNRTAAYVREQSLSKGGIVYGFYQWYDCGAAVIGSHTFSFTTTSVNYPWNSLTATAVFNVK